MTNITIQEFTLQVIGELIGSKGPQMFSEVLHEVREQCPGVNSANVNNHTKTHLDYLVKLGSVIEYYDQDLSPQYGYPSDF